MVENKIPEKFHPAGQAQDIGEPSAEVTSSAARPAIASLVAQAGVKEIGDHVNAEMAIVSPLTVVGEHTPTAGLGNATVTFSKPGEFPPLLKTGRFTGDGNLLGGLAEKRMGELVHKPGEHYVPPVEHGLVDFLKHLFSRKPKPAAQAA